MTYRSILALGGALAALATGALSPAQAAVFKFSQGFSPTINTPTSDWSYWERPVSGPPVLLINSKIFKIWKVSFMGTPGNTLGWNDPNTPNAVPAFFAHTNNIAWWGRGSCCGPVTLPGKSVFIHPGAGGEQAILSFLVPPKLGGGSYTQARLKGQITDVDYNGGDGITWSVEHNGVPVTGMGGVLDSTSATSLASAILPSTAIPVTTGDRVDIVVDPNADEYFDSTALAGEIELF